jgi:hypothetical protein
MGSIMDEASIARYITETFENVETAESSGDVFFFNDPERKFPFATLVTGDNYDQVSNLNRPGVFRLNVGAGKETFKSLFGSAAKESYDFAALDQIMPHPVYGMMYWICVLSPSDATFEKVKPLLAEAYEMWAKKRSK